MTSRGPSSADGQGRPLDRRRDAAVRAACTAETERLRAAGWRGERLAQALADVPLATQKLLAPDNVRAWVELVLALSATADGPALLRALPVEIGSWSGAEQAAWLATARVLPAPAALELYRDGPLALRGLAPAVRTALLALTRVVAERAPAALLPVVPLLGPLVRAVPPPVRRAALARTAEVAAVQPALVPALLRSLARLYEEAPADRVRHWIAHGLAVAADSPAAGEAYFALASRTSLRVLHDSATAVSCEEVQGQLRQLIHMLSGEPAVPRAAGRVLLRPPLEDTPNGRGVALPQVVDVLDTVEGNARLYRVNAALLAGRRLAHTYDAAPDLAAYLRAPERHGNLEDLFLLADGYRVACRLAAAYPGFADDFRWAGSRLVRAAVPGAVFDGVLALAFCPEGERAGAPAWLAATAALVLPSLVPLAAPQATAADALRTAERLTVFFPELELREGTGVLPDLITLLLDGEGDEASFADGVAVDADGQSNGETWNDEPPEPLPPELAQRLEVLLDERLAADGGAPRALTAEELERLLEAGLGMRLSQASGDVIEQAGLYVTQLLGKRLADAPPPPPGLGPADTPRRVLRAGRPTPDDAPAFRYDEWDHGIADYRPDWCTLREVELPGDSGLYFGGALARHAALVPEIRRHFLRLRPELYRPVRGLEDGQEFDLNAVVDARAQRRARHAPSSKLYTARVRQERDVATLFLLDMSASTDETAPRAADRIIDIAKDAMIVMAAALEEIGDAYAIYGFSGQGRDRVEMYPVKAFNERLTPAVQSRIGGLEPRGSTRMGTALRHALSKMRHLTAPARHLLLLSDGFPQDLDYGTDRASHVYGIRDTAVALREVQAAGVRPFCITVDLAGHDYLREMCDRRQYLVIENVAGLPHELPKIYQRLVHAA